MKLLKLLAVLALFQSCAPGQDKTLPILGRQEIKGNDTIYQTIADFKFLDQDSNWISNSSFDGKLYIADFFFTSCPSICPIMKKQMLRVYKKFEGNPAVNFLSHTIDPRHDSVAVLHEYAKKMGVSSDQWHFVWGPREAVYAIAEGSYMVPTKEDSSVPGGFVHGGHFILVDHNRHIRGIYDGTDPDAVDQLISDLPLLLKEVQGQ